MADSQSKSEQLFDAEAELRLAAMNYARSEKDGQYANSDEAAKKRTELRRKLRDAAKYYTRVADIVDGDEP